MKIRDESSYCVIYELLSRKYFELYNHPQRKNCNSKILVISKVIAKVIIALTISFTVVFINI